MVRAPSSVPRPQTPWRTVPAILAFTALSALPARVRADEPPAAPAPAAAPAGACTNGTCHANKINAVDARHSAKGITCAMCHTNVAKPQESHKGVDASPKEMCGRSGCHVATSQGQLAGKHKDTVCSTCHGDVHTSFKRADYAVCGDCHGEQASAVADSKHGKADKPVVCGNCHGDVHNPKKVKDLDSVARCGNTDCHGDKHKALSESAHGKAKNPATCKDCHSEPHGLKSPSDLPLKNTCGRSACHAEVVQKYQEGPHKESVCATCHGDLHSDFKKADYSGCDTCHGDQVAALATSVHGAKSKKPVGCGDCHGDIHKPASKKDPNSGFKVLQVENCSECHDKEYVRAYRTSVHGQGVLKSGLAVSAACADCHGSHEITKVKDPESKMAKKNVTATCGACHTLIASRWKKSVHGKHFAEERAAAEGKGTAPVPEPSDDGEHERPREAPVCTNCHQGHLTFDPMIYGNHLRMAERCATCHKSESESYRDTFHGKATRLDYQIAATCANCHTAHEMLPKSDPRSTVNPANLEATCGNCHKPMNGSFVTFDVHMDPHNVKRSKVVHYVWLFMTTLLVSVLAFFAVHALLWLQRAIVALRRGELHRPPRNAEVWVRRFKPVHIKIHLMIVTTFLLLASTGLPLKFSNVAWAKPIEAVFGGLQVARWLHRIAGVFTFGYGIAYLAYIIREVMFRGRTEILWGWKSMVPSRKDLTDVIANLRWFLYLGPPPKLDRWAYWEKFDFFAVFWGIPVIGLSGLCLWMPLFVSKFMPGSWINIAYLLHSDEALLATGFIFYFHFFHTHLRPEAFPLDTVIFLGGMPLERLKEERPTEYQRLKDSGELEKLLMPAPSERTVRRAYRFGTVALIVGLILGAFLIAASVKVVLH